MTKEELRAIAFARREEITHEEWVEVIRLAKLGLRAEHQRCGTCVYRNDAFRDGGYHCYMVSNTVGPMEGCSRWRAKDGAE